MFDWLKRLVGGKEQAVEEQPVPPAMNPLAVGDGVIFTAMTSKGNVRKINQDNLYIGKEIETAQNLVEYRSEGYQPFPVLFAVCDGMGGERDGEKASEMAAAEIKAFAEGSAFHRMSGMDTDAIEKLLTEALRGISKKLYEALGSSRNGVSGCTVTMLYLERERYVIANIGDSPGFLVRDGRISLLTLPDNRAQQLYQLGVLSEEERWSHHTKSQLTQFLGMNPDDADLSPHFQNGECRKKDLFVIGSDGMTDGLNPDAILAISEEPEVMESRPEDEAAMNLADESTVELMDESTVDLTNEPSPMFQPDEQLPEHLAEPKEEVPVRKPQGASRREAGTIRRRLR